MSTTGSTGSTPYRDAYISEVVVVLDDLSTERTQEVVKHLEAAGLSVDHVNDDNSVVEGRIEMHKVADLQKVDSVRYVRTHFTYAAEVPPGHPGDRNNA